MSESGRKRKSKWDCVGEPQLPTQISEKDAWHEKGSCSDLNVGRDPKFSDLEDENAKGSVSQKEDRRDLNDFSDAKKAWDGERSYHVSLTFDRLEPQNLSRSPENSRNLSSRYRRSRSRDRDRGRGRSRSRSPTRGRGRSRDRDWEDRGRGRGRSRSRSPLESYRWTDRRRTEFPNRSGKSTVLCNDFMKGRCYRGPSCKFSHDDDDPTRYNTERRNRDYSFDRDYRPQRRSIADTPCKFFMMGICNRENCRFSHAGPVEAYSEVKSLSGSWGNVEVETFIDPALTEKQTDDRRGHSWGNNSENTNLADVANSFGSEDVHPTTVMHSVFPEDYIFQQQHQNQHIVYASAPHPDFLPNTDGFPSVGGIDQSQHIVSVNPSNGLDIDLNGPVRPNYSSPSNLENPSQIQHEESVHNEQVGQLSTFPLSLMQIIGNGQLPQLYAALNSTKPDPDLISQNQCNNPIPDSIQCTSNDAIDSVELHKNDFPEDDFQVNPELIIQQKKTVEDSGCEGNHKSIAEKRKLENVDEKAMRLFKIALVDFVKEILKPKWKEGQMTREVHKNIVKKVVDKVTSAIHGANVPKTQDKIDQYLLHSKTKLTKLVEAYAEKFSKCP